MGDAAHAAFLKRTMVVSAPTKVDVGVISKPVNRETSSCFESTVYKGSARPGQHPDLPPVDGDDAFTIHVTTQRLRPTAFLAKGGGGGGTANAAAAAALRAHNAEQHRLAGPPPAHSKAARPNPPNTDFRKYYERSDLPCSIVHSSPMALNWKADVGALDLHHYLPIFFSGLREIEEPYRFVSLQGITDLLRNNSEDKVLPVVPQLILPMKDALATRSERILVKTLRVLQMLVAVGPRVGAALVPYYRQLLPVVNIFAGSSLNMGDKMDFAQRKGHLGELIQETLQKLEMGSGPDAYINIKYMVPGYESCMLA